MADDTSASDNSDFRALFDAALDAVLILDDDRRYVDVNPAACELLGETRAELIGRRIDDFAPPRSDADVLASWAMFMDAGRLAGEFPTLRGDGEIRETEFRSVANFVPGRHLSILRDVTERKRTERGFRELAERDALTGVLNHGAIFSELARLVEAGAPFSLAVVDVDRLKATNDTYGHLIGDRVLREAARILAADGAIVGRWGGDEFLMLLPGAGRVRAEEQRAEMMEAAKQTIVIDEATGNRVAVRMTMGLAASPTEGSSADALIRIADGAMYASRKTIRSAQRINNSADGDMVSKLMSDLIPLLATKADLPTKLRLVAQHLSIGAGYEAVDFQMFTEEESSVVLTTYHNEPASFNEEWSRNQQNEEGGEHVLRRLLLSTRRPIIFNDVESDTRLALAERTLLLRTGIKSGLLIPLIWQDEVIGTLGIGSSRREGIQPPDVAFLVAVAHQVAPMIRMSALIDGLNAATGRLADAQLETVMMLAAAAEASDPGTGEHLRRVSATSELIALELGMTVEEAKAIRLAAILHDIGKIRVPHTILLKPGALTETEWKTMRLHAKWGHSFLSEHDGFDLAADVACAHHERWDGKGYPTGLAGEAIPEAARIVSVADAFDAITIDRPYRMGRSFSWAIAEIQAHSGSQFDPRAVDALARLHERGQLASVENERPAKAA